MFLTACGGEGMSEADYLAHIQHTRADIGRSLQRFASLSRSPQVNNTSWLRRVGAELAMWEAAYEHDKDLSPPASLRELHNKHVEMLRLLSDAADDNRNGIAYLDDALINRGKSKLDHASRISQEVDALIRTAS